MIPSFQPMRTKTHISASILPATVRNFAISTALSKYAYYCLARCGGSAKQASAAPALPLKVFNLMHAPLTDHPSCSSAYP